MNKQGLTINIPGSDTLHIKTLLLDYNGTLALDGNLLPEVTERLTTLSKFLDVQIITADTHGTVRSILQNAGIHDLLKIYTLPSDKNQTQAKLEHLKQCGVKQTCAIGNGRNDALMLQNSALSIAIIGGEGACFAALQNAHIVCTNILHALDLLQNQMRIVATLRE